MQGSRCLLVPRLGSPGSSPSSFASSSSDGSVYPFRGRVTTNVVVRDLDLRLPDAAHGRRLEVAVDGLPLFGGAQLAVDTTMVGAVHTDGTAIRGASNADGVAVVAARRRKERTFPELVGPRARARLVVLGVEVGGRLSTETQSFLSRLAKAKANGEVPLMCRTAEQAWRLRWRSLLSCTAARAVATSMLELRGGQVLTVTLWSRMRSISTTVTLVWCE